MRGRLVLIAFTLAISLSGCLQTGGGLFGGDAPVDPYDYLRKDDYSHWYVEVDHVEGSEPRGSALSLLDDRLTESAQKDRITVAVGSTLPSKARWTNNDLLALRDTHQDRHTGGDTVVTYVAYVDGEYAEEGGSQTLGLTMGHDFVVIFKQRVESACGIPDPRSVDSTDPRDFLPCIGGEERIEQAVLVHEFGHAIGLVNRGIPMVKDHEDPEHERHSNNDQSIMYWAVESAGTLMEFTTQIPLEFDADDKADICQAGGRC